jgi:hypothetical protein
MSLSDLLQKNREWAAAQLAAIRTGLVKVVVAGDT